MICPNCSMNFDDNMLYCPNCETAVNNSTSADNGAAVNNSAYVNNGDGVNNGAAFNNNGYQQSAPYSTPPYGNPAYYQPQQPEKNPTLWQYVGWMLIGSLFGPISIIISIVFACMSDNKPRATFFKAHLIIMAISLVVSIIAIIILGFIGFAFTDVITDASYEIYNEFMQIASLLG